MFRPLLPRGEHRHCQILSPPLVGGFLYSPVRLPCCSWLLGTEEPCPALSNWCFALIPLAGLRPELARWLQRAAVNPVPHLWVLERINLLAVQAFKGGNLLVLNRQNARLSALGTGRSRLIGHRRFQDENTSVPPVYQSVGVPAKSFNPSGRSRRSLRIGKGESGLGPITTHAQFEKVQSYFEVARKDGAKVAIGGKTAEGPGLEGGWYVEPTVYTGVTSDMVIAREEVFVPVVCVIPFKDESDAVRIANGLEYGLAAGIWSRDIGKVHRVAANSKPAVSL